MKGKEEWKRRREKIKKNKKRRAEKASSHVRMAI
jgi:hypothetical protein